ncbi:MAG: Trk system potassium transporter TrkA [Bryobacteraceae bacterium]|nr:Trk system potassium transporter TrkA [Bryobacteraceae bacterium]
MRILVVGGGDVGALITRRLAREGNEITLVEKDEDRCHRLEESLDAHIVRGDGASYKSLKTAGLQTADMLIAVTSSDEINLLACLIAQAEFGVRVKVARLRTHEVDHWRRICQDAGLHIDLIIHPESELAARLLPVLALPGVSDIVEFAGGKVKLIGFTIERDSWLAGSTLEELVRRGPPKHSLVAMIFRGSQVIIPHGAERLQAEDHVYIVTRDQDLPALLRFMGLHQQERLERVFILGGKQIGIKIAEDLEKRKVAVKIFERDPKRCHKMSEILDHTVVVNGDGGDAELLTEENIDGVSAYLALTNDDEDNLIAALLARRLGARKVAALINRLNYLPLAQRLGISTTLSPRLVTVDRILQFVRKGVVLSVTTFREEEAEAIELMAVPGSPFLGKPLRDLKLPREAIVGAIVRTSGEAVVPRGDAVIEEGDRVIFFTLEGTVPKLEKAFLAGRPGSR